jgi:hypothetical protein
MAEKIFLIFIFHVNTTTADLKLLLNKPFINYLHCLAIKRYLKTSNTHLIWKEKNVI